MVVVLFILPVLFVHSCNVGFENLESLKTLIGGAQFSQFMCGKLRKKNNQEYMMLVWDHVIQLKN